MKITIQAFTLEGFHLPDSIVPVYLRIYSLQYFIGQSDGEIHQPSDPQAGPFYQQWPLTRSGTDLLLPEITLESTLDALSPAHPEQLRYFVGIYDWGGKFICALWPYPIFALDVNPNPTTWPLIWAYNSAGVQFDWTTELFSHYSKEEFNALFQNPPQPPPPPAIVVAPPLTWDGVTLGLPRSSASQDGYLAAADYARFNAPITGGAPGGVNGDIQMNLAGVFAASLARQDLGIAGGAPLLSAGDLSDPKQAFLPHNAITIKTPLTQNVTGANLATGLRVMDIDDGAGNAAWFELLGSYGAFNFQWQHTGTGTPSREFFIDNGRSRIVMHGFWRGNVDEGDQIALFTLDPNPHDDPTINNFRFMNALTVSGEWHPMDVFQPGVYIKAHNSDSSYGYAYGYQYYFDHDGLNLPKDPTLTTHAATKAYVDAKVGGPGGVDQTANYAWTGVHTFAQPISIGANPAQSGTVRLTAAGSIVSRNAGNTADIDRLTCNGGFTEINRMGGVNGSGFVVGTYGRVGFGTNSGEASVRLTIPVDASNFPVAIQMGDGVSIAASLTIGTPTFGLYMTSSHTAKIAAGSTLFTFESGGSLLLPGDPTSPLHAATMQYVLAHAGGGSPAGSGTEIQYRASSSALGAVAGSSVDSNGNIHVPQRFFIAGNSGMSAPPEFHLATGAAAGTAHFAIDDGMGSVTPFAVFAAYNDSAKPGQLYIGRSNWGTVNPAMRVSIWTSPTGIFANGDGTRRFHVSANGNVTINTINGGGSAPADNAYSCTIERGSSGTAFAKALLVSGEADIQTLAIYDGTVYAQVQIGLAGSGPSGSGRALYLT